MAAKIDKFLIFVAMKKCLAILIASLFCLASVSFAQNQDLNKAEALQFDSLIISRVFYELPENVQILQSEQIMTAFPRHINVNVRKPRKANQFGIRIYSNSGPAARDESAQIVSRFRGQFPGTEVVRAFNSPYFMVTVGRYATKGEAEHALNSLRYLYPRAFVVKK